MQQHTLDTAGTDLPVRAGQRDGGRSHATDQVMEERLAHPHSPHGTTGRDAEPTVWPVTPPDRIPAASLSLVAAASPRPVPTPSPPVLPVPTPGLNAGRGG
ncbi:hypothetical protein GCM10023317_51080 [Actinopolymorpha pittospori]